MKATICALIGILVCLQSCLAGPEGLWGGKWDDEWTVFLNIEPGVDTGSYKVQYIWLEDVKNSSYSRKELMAKQVGAHFEATFLTFKLEGDKGLLYGAFHLPRMANLVKITLGLPPVSECEAVLRKHQWKEGAIPPPEALEKIKKGESGMVNGSAGTAQQGPAAGAQDNRSLGEFLVGTKWLWYGSPNNAMTFKQDGTIEFPNWTNKGLVTGWKVTGKNKVTLKILKGRTNNTTATLEFASDRGSFTGKDFNGSSAIAKSPRVP